MNAADLLRDAAMKFGTKPALIFHGIEIGFSELDERVDRTAAALARLGVGKGDRVAILAGNVPEFVYALYGTMRAGAVACPLNVMLTPEETAYILADAGAKLAVTDLRSLPGLLSIRDRLGELQNILVIGGPPAPPGTVSFEEALKVAGHPPVVQTESSDLAVIAYTAGTTADPKGAMLTHGNLLSNLEQMSAVPALAEASEDVGLLALPLFHSYALNVILGITMKTGATAVLVERFDPRETLEVVKRHGVTVLFGAPPMFQAWLALADAGYEADLSTVRLAVSGAAPLPPAVLQAFRERFGVTIWEGYGLTEAAPAVTTNALGPEAKAGSIGLPLPGLEVRLVDEHGEDVEEGDPGELLVRGPNVFSGYWGRPEETGRVIDGDWLKTGDVAVRDEDGYLFLVDRKKDLIIVSGFNVYPNEVEEAIEKHPKVAEAAVVGVVDERTGEAVGAWVVPRPGESVSGEEIVDFLNGYLARFKWPKEVHVVEELPHHVTGKVLRRTLRQAGAAQGEERSAAEDLEEEDLEAEQGRSA
ncbi:MAG: long-chain fatty acid--CoA ligase [Actinomycetota bacterium]|nr:long-chain fatty acid--CoA ligase [Actinomycetota bacterium]